MDPILPNFNFMFFLIDMDPVIKICRYFQLSKFQCIFSGISIPYSTFQEFSSRAFLEYIYIYVYIKKYMPHSRYSKTIRRIFRTFRSPPFPKFSKRSIYDIFRFPNIISRKKYYGLFSHYFEYFWCLQSQE